MKNLTNFSRLCCIAFLVIGIALVWNISLPKEVAGDQTGGCRPCSTYDDDASCGFLMSWCYDDEYYYFCPKDPEGSGACIFLQMDCPSTKSPILKCDQESEWCEQPAK